MSIKLRAEQVEALARERYAARLATVVEASGGRVRSEGPNGALLVSDAAGRDTRVALGANGLPTTVRTPEGRAYQAEIEDDGKLRKLSNPAGYEVELQYDATGRVDRFLSAGTEAWRLRYDETGRVAAIAYPDSTTSAFAFGAGSAGLLLTDRLGQTQSFEFEGRRLVALTNGTGARTRFEYSGWDRPVRMVLPDGQAQTYVYDREGDVASIRWGQSASVEVKVNVHRRPLELRYANGQIVRFSYDDSGELVQATDDVQKCVFRRTSGRVVEEIQGSSRVRYEHDTIGNVAVLTYPDGGVVGFQYDQDDRVIEIRDWAGGRHHYRYLPDDRGHVEEFPGGLSATVGYLPSGAPAIISCIDSTGRQLFATRFSYDNTARVKNTDDTEFGTVLYTYDAEGQLVSAHGLGASQSETFAYDAAGNRIRANASSFSFDGGDKQLAHEGIALTYDDRGNHLTAPSHNGPWRLKWDERNRLIAASGPGGQHITFGYDPLGRRIWKRATAHSGKPPTETSYTWAGEQIVSQVTKTGSTVRRQDFLYFPGTFRPVATRIDGRIFDYHCDHRGAPIRITDRQGRVVWSASYGAFGLATIHRQEIESSIRLSGQWEDSETGLHYNRFRYYSPILGRYLSRDPTGLVGGFNLYTYAGNDPVNQIDPLGLWWKAALSIVAGVAVAALVVVTAPVSAPLLLVGAAAAALGVGVGLGVNKALNLKDPNPEQIATAFVSGFIGGAAIGLGIVGAMLAAPAAATAIGVGAAAIGIVAMCDEHFGLNLMPWEHGNVAFSEMTAEQQNHSLGSLAGGLLGGLLAGSAVGGPKGKTFTLPELPEFGGMLPALDGPPIGAIPAAEPATITVPANAAPGAAAGSNVMMMSGGGSGGGGGDDEEPPRRREQTEGDVTLESEEAARAEALRRHGAADESLYESQDVYGSNDNLKGPKGEPYERVTTIDKDGNEVTFDHHKHGHEFKDNNTFEYPHFHGPDGEHISYPPQSGN